jgi:nitrogen fixation/metabolism regulation signal transduction histidine kinase
MKKNYKTKIINTSLIIIIFSIISILYFGYEIVKPILDFINTNIEIVDYMSVINNFFK